MVKEFEQVGCNPETRKLIAKEVREVLSKLGREEINCEKPNSLVSRSLLDLACCASDDTLIALRSYLK